MTHFFPALILTHSGFGINTNILETNIINLAAVVAIVVSFVGQNFTSILEERKKTIVNNLEEANKRAADSQEKLKIARTQLELAKKTADEIRQEGLQRTTQELNNCFTQHELRIARLEEFKNETLEFYQQKALKQTSSFVISRIMTRVRERLTTGLDNNSKIIVANFYVSLLCEFA
jgi:F-type H+-transporting ATPase subunit b